MSLGKIMFKCDVCSMSYQQGLHRYEGHRLELYGDIFACDCCWNANHDGWAPRYEKVLLGHLERQGLPIPPRNGKCLLPRD